MADKGTVVVTNDAGASYVKLLVGTATWDPATAATDGSVSAAATMTVTGAVPGDPCIGALTTNTVEGDYILASVTATDTVSYQVFNKSGAESDLASGTVKVLVVKI
jgi:hypothetical protein